MPLRSIARLIQTMLYNRRMFPYYVYNILAGIEVDGSGAVYSFDPVGSYEREACRAAGAAQSLLQPFLDNQVSVSSLIQFHRVGHLADSRLAVILPMPLDLLPQPAPAPWRASTRSRPPPTRLGSLDRHRRLCFCDREAYRGRRRTRDVLVRRQGPDDR